MRKQGLNAAYLRGSVVGVEDLVGVVRRHRHLGGADEVEVLPLDPVDVVGRLAEEAGAVHRPGTHQRRWDRGGEPGLARLVHRHVDQRQLEVGAGSGEVVEPGAGDLRAAVDVDRAEHPAELDVVPGLEPLGREVARGADVLEHHEVVLAAGGRLLGGRVGDGHHQPAVGLRGLVLRRLGRLHRGGQLLGASEQGLLLLDPAPAGSACRAASAPRAAARTPRSTCAAARRPPAPRRRRRGTARGAAGRRRMRSGSSRRSRGSITGSCYRRRPHAIRGGRHAGQGG